MTTAEAYEVVADAIRTGEEWGKDEIQLWMDQHGDMRRASEWKRGTYCGRLPANETSDWVEAIIDLAAERVWEAAR